MARKAKNPIPAQAADHLASDLQPLGEITKRTMFGGYGLFHETLMFAIIDTTGATYLRADETTQPGYQAAGSVAHGAMPYWTIPEAVRDNNGELLAWARQAVDVAIAAKRT